MQAAPSTPRHVDHQCFAEIGLEGNRTDGRAVDASVRRRIGMSTDMRSGGDSVDGDGVTAAEVGRDSAGEVRYRLATRASIRR